MFYNKISTVKKIVLSSSRGQGNFRGPNASRPRPRTGDFEAKVIIIHSKDILEDSTSGNS